MSKNVFFGGGPTSNTFWSGDGALFWIFPRAFQENAFFLQYIAREKEVILQVLQKTYRKQHVCQYIIRQWGLSIEKRILYKFYFDQYLRNYSVGTQEERELQVNVLNFHQGFLTEIVVQNVPFPLQLYHFTRKMRHFDEKLRHFPEISSVSWRLNMHFLAKRPKRGESGIVFSIDWLKKKFDLEKKKIYDS